MTDAISAITAHYRANEKQHIDVPEWMIDGVPLRIHWNLLTVEERSKLQTAGRNDVDALIALARTSAGEKMFTVEHKGPLLKVADAGIISRVVEKMLASALINAEGREAIEKN
jgi:hypothetical protein